MAYRRASDLKPWIVEFLLSENPMSSGHNIHITKYISGPHADGSIIKEGTDLDVSINVRFDAQALAGFSKAKHSQSPDTHEEFNRAYILLKKYKPIHIKGRAKASSYFEIVVSDFALWMDGTGLRLKVEPVPCMNVPEVRRHSDMLFVNRKSYVEEEMDDSEPLTAMSMSDLPLTQLVEQMQNDASQDSCTHKQSPTSYTRSPASQTRSPASCTRSLTTRSRSPAFHTRSSTSHTRSPASHIRSSTSRTRSLTSRSRSPASHIRSSTSFTRSPASQTRCSTSRSRSLSSHTRSPASHTRSPNFQTRSLISLTRSPPSNIRSPLPKAKSPTSHTRSPNFHTRSLISSIRSPASCTRSSTSHARSPNAQTKSPTSRSRSPVSCEKIPASSHCTSSGESTKLSDQTRACAGAFSKKQKLSSLSPANMPVRLSANLDLAVYTISQMQQAQLDSIQEWRANYRPPKVSYLSSSSPSQTPDCKSPAKVTRKTEGSQSSPQIKEASPGISKLGGGRNFTVIGTLTNIPQKKLHQSASTQEKVTGSSGVDANVQVGDSLPKDSQSHGRAANQTETAAQVGDSLMNQESQYVTLSQSDLQSQCSLEAMVKVTPLKMTPNRIVKLPNRTALSNETVIQSAAVENNKAEHESQFVGSLNNHITDTQGQHVVSSGEESRGKSIQSFSSSGEIGASHADANTTSVSAKSLRARKSSSRADDADSVDVTLIDGLSETSLVADVGDYNKSIEISCSEEFKLLPSSGSHSKTPQSKEGSEGSSEKNMNSHRDERLRPSRTSSCGKGSPYRTSPRFGNKHQASPAGPISLTTFYKEKRSSLRRSPRVSNPVLENLTDNEDVILPTPPKVTRNLYPAETPFAKSGKARANRCQDLGAQGKQISGERRERDRTTNEQDAYCVQPEQAGPSPRKKAKIDSGQIPVPAVDVAVSLSGKPGANSDSTDSYVSPSTEAGSASPDMPVSVGTKACDDAGTPSLALDKSVASVKTPEVVITRTDADLSPAGVAKVPYHSTQSSSNAPPPFHLTFSSVKMQGTVKKVTEDNNNPTNNSFELLPDVVVIKMDSGGKKLSPIRGKMLSPIRDYSDKRQTKKDSSPRRQPSLKSLLVDSLAEEPTSHTTHSPERHCEGVELPSGSSTTPTSRETSRSTRNTPRVEDGVTKTQKRPVTPDSVPRDFLAEARDFLRMVPGKQTPSRSSPRIMSARKDQAENTPGKPPYPRADSETMKSDEDSLRGNDDESDPLPPDARPQPCDGVMEQSEDTKYHSASSSESITCLDDVAAPKKVQGKKRKHENAERLGDEAELQGVSTDSDQLVIVDQEKTQEFFTCLDTPLKRRPIRASVPSEVETISDDSTIELDSTDKEQERCETNSKGSSKKSKVLHLKPQKSRKSHQNKDTGGKKGGENRQKNRDLCSDEDLDKRKKTKSTKITKENKRREDSAKGGSSVEGDSEKDTRRGVRGKRKVKSRSPRSGKDAEWSAREESEPSDSDDSEEYLPSPRTAKGKKAAPGKNITKKGPKSKVPKKGPKRKMNLVFTESRKIEVVKDLDTTRDVSILFSARKQNSKKGAKMSSTKKRRLFSDRTMLGEPLKEIQEERTPRGGKLRTKIASPLKPLTFPESAKRKLYDILDSTMKEAAENSPHTATPTSAPQDRGDCLNKSGEMEKLDKSSGESGSDSRGVSLNSTCSPGQGDTSIVVATPRSSLPSHQPRSGERRSPRKERPSNASKIQSILSAVPDDSVLDKDTPVIAFQPLPDDLLGDLCRYHAKDQ